MHSRAGGRGGDAVKYPAAKTPVTTRQMAAALRSVWPSAPPVGIELATAHSALETGWWRECWNWNIGNAKATPEQDHCYYPAGEELEPAYAERLRAASPSLVTVVGPSKREGLVSVSFRPEHPMSRFRSFPSLVASVGDHVAMLRADFPGAWAALATGDPALYVAALKREGYFTAAEGPYRDGVAGCLAMVRRQLAGPWQPEWERLDGPARLVALFRSCAGWQLPADREKLAWLVGGGVDDEVWANQVALWSTNCAESLLGAIQRACLDDVGRRACSPILMRRSQIGMSLSWVVELMRAKGMRLGVPTEPALLWYGNAGVNNDHVALQCSEWRGAETEVCEGGGAANRISAGKRDTMRSWGRPLRGWTPVAALGLPGPVAPAFDGSAEALRNAIAAGRALRVDSLSERETLPPPSE